VRINAQPFGSPDLLWRPYDADRLAGIGAPVGAVAALTGRGLPDCDQFGRVPERELEVAELPGCGRAAFLGQVWDGFNNSYWLGLADGRVWMRYGTWDEPDPGTKPINASVEALQSVLAVYAQFENEESDDQDDEEHEGLIIQTVIHPVAADPEAFEDGENWWPIVFQEVGFYSRRIMLGERDLFELVDRDTLGQWGVDHPGYEQE